MARAEFDYAAAVTLAKSLRTITHEHRPLPGDSGLVQSITVPPAPPSRKCGTALDCTTSQISSGPYFPRGAGMPPYIDTWVARLHTSFGQPNLRQQPEVEQAMAAQTRALVLHSWPRPRTIWPRRRSEAFSQHPDAKILDGFQRFVKPVGRRHP